jgi:membrane associated rhomboid family serine protease
LAASSKDTGGKQRTDGLSPVLAWIAVLWLIQIADIALTQRFHPDLATERWGGGWLGAMFGIEPLTLRGLLCIPTAPLMHANFAHLGANSIGLLVLGWPSWRYSPKLTRVAVGYAVLYGGALAWLLGDIGQPPHQHTCHIGASGVIFGLIGFLIGNGLFRRGCMPLILGVVTAVLFAGVLPEALPGGSGSTVPVSWQMHLGGLIGGLSASWHLREEKR